MEEHGWKEYFKVDILDAEGPDLVLDIKNGEKIKKNFVGKNIEKYDSMLVLSHFKGHPMGDPCITDIGILISDDPIAIDQACIDLVYSSSDLGKPHLIERIESRNGIHTIEAAAKLGYGSREYELIEI